MENNTNYKKLYLEKYRNLPSYYALTTLLSIGISATIVSIIFWIIGADSSDFMIAMGFIILLVGWLLASGIGVLVLRISSICISQSIVVADSLLKISESSAPSVEETLSSIEEELPEI